MLPDIQPGNTKILYFFNCLLDGMHTTYHNSFFFIVVFLQFSIEFCFSGCLFLITNSKLVIYVGKIRGLPRRLCELTREKFFIR